jgi:hypothetical protein
LHVSHQVFTAFRHFLPNIQWLHAFKIYKCGSAALTLVPTARSQKHTWNMLFPIVILLPAKQQKGGGYCWAILTRLSQPIVFTQWLDVFIF